MGGMVRTRARVSEMRFRGVYLMAISRNKTRVQMSLPNELLADIDEYCKRAHMSRTVWIEYTLASSIASTRELLDKAAAGMVSAATKDV